MAESSNRNRYNTVRITVYSDGTKIKDNLGIISVYVYRAVNRIGRCILKVDAGNMPQAEIPESDDDTFAPGKRIHLEAGYGDDAESLFEGFVTSHKLDIREGNECTLVIECREYTFPMTQGRNSRVFSSKKDSEAINEIIGAYPDLKPEVTGTTVKYNELVQYYCTDWDFLLSRADANGLVVSVDGNNIRVKAPETGGKPVVKVTYGMDLIAFDGDLTADDQQAKVEVYGWDVAQQEVLSAVGKPPSLNKQGNMQQKDLAKAAGNNDWMLQTVICEGMEPLQSWANAQLLKSGLARIQGTVKFYGHAGVIPGCTILLDGLGKRFNGNAYIGTVEHEIRQGEWITTAGMGLPYEQVTERNDVMSPPAAGLVPGIGGLHIGKVTKLDEDPAKEYRIQVRIPVLSGDNKLVWARLGNVWAGDAFGFFFIPDVGDEVILGFFNNDPSYPVILGSLYNGKSVPPYELTAENFIRGVVTKQKIKLTFHEEDKEITFETPGGNKIIVSDKEKGITLIDENKNKIKTDANGVTIDSAKNLVLKAQNNISIESGTAVAIKAKTDLKSEGLNVETKAKASLKMQGTASAELSASGQTVVKGAMVMIN